MADDESVGNGELTSVNTSGVFKDMDIDGLKINTCFTHVKNVIEEVLTLCVYKDEDIVNDVSEPWVKDVILTCNSISIIAKLLETIKNKDERLIIIENLNIVINFNLNMYGLDMVIKEIVKYTCVGNTLPVVMCTLLGTTKTLDELRMSTEVNGNKPHLLINHLKFKENVREMWTKLVMEALHKDSTSLLIFILRKIFENNLNDPSFVNSHLDLILNTTDCLIHTYLEKERDDEHMDQHDLLETWKLILKNLLITHENEVLKRCSLVVINYVTTKEANLEFVESTVNRYIKDLSLCSKKNDIRVRFLYQFWHFANSIDHSKAIKCCELASYIDGSLLYTGGNGNYTDTSGECFNTVYALYSYTYVFTKQFFKIVMDLNYVDGNFVNIMAQTICNVNVIADLLKYFPNRTFRYKIKTSIFENIKTSVADIFQSQPKKMAFNIIITIIEKIIYNGPYWSKSLEFALDMMSLPNDELITFYKFAMSKFSDCPNVVHIVQNFVRLCGINNLEYDFLSLADIRCVWNVHFKNISGNEMASQMRKVLDSDEKLLISNITCLTREKNMIETIRSLEFLNLVFLQPKDQSIILKYSETTFSYLESLMLTLTEVVKFNHELYWPLGLITAMAASLFVKINFCSKSSYKDSQKSDENPNEFRLSSRVLSNCFINIWINFSQECENCIHELVLESLTICFKYLELKQPEQINLFYYCSKLISSDHYQTEISSYSILDRLCELRTVEMNTDPVFAQLPYELRTLPLNYFQDLVTEILKDIRVGHTFEPKPFTLKFKNIRVYLLLWNLILKLCLKLKSQVRYEFIFQIKIDNSVLCLMENLLKLMPHSIIKPYSKKVKPITKELFNLRPECTPKMYWSNKKLWNLVCWTYYNLLYTLPAIVSEWWRSNRYTPMGKLVNLVTSKYISQILIDQTFLEIKQSVQNMDKCVVNFYKSNNIFVVSYLAEEEHSLDTIIQLQNNHPLSFSRLKRVGTDMNKVLSLRRDDCWPVLDDFISDQNGSIIDGISEWYSSLTDTLNGVEDCFICLFKLNVDLSWDRNVYYLNRKKAVIPVPHALIGRRSSLPYCPKLRPQIIETFHCQLPNYTCEVCQKKSHRLCLIQWIFINYTCPACRSLISGVIN